MVEILTDSTATARKTHKCVWCAEKIEVGQQYHQQSGIFDREPFRCRYHNECYAAMQELFKLDRYAVEDGFSEGSFKRGTYMER
jgi:hypothetical protein